jgi:isopenicillin N synthase-like dioxygenase
MLAPDQLVPTVDLAPFLEGGPAGRATVVAAVSAACRRTGFLQIRGHGIDGSVIAAMNAATDAFFALPLERKLLAKPAHPGINRGYAPVGAEALSYSLGIEAPPDLFEAFNIGLEDVPDAPFYRNAPHDFFAPNVWPDDVPDLRPALTRYFDEAVRVALTLTDVFALALGMPERWFRPYVEKSTLTMRVNHYEHRDGSDAPAPGSMRMGAHTDYGVVTVLYADPVPGLEILGPDGAWHAVAPEEGALLVNLGDLTAQWTNDVWRSTLHRVVPASHRRRSVALFFDGNYDALVTCLPTCTGPDAPPKYPPVLAGEHLFAKIMGPRTFEKTASADTAGERLRAVRS